MILFLTTFILPLLIALLAEFFGYWLNRKDK